MNGKVKNVADRTDCTWVIIHSVSIIGVGSWSFKRGFNASARDILANSITKQGYCNGG